ncbi:hypothetical protein GCM10023185_25130 [Hymenobacter saemangeumensis]|uniref:DUF1579 domain-containing protein n=1 Tax=Hymenobacter saemangeumensis TaxID=1084522 RepID=A0ABP8IHI1_9BACT
MKTLYTLLLTAGTLLPAVGRAQTTPTAAERIKPLLFLEGQWKGRGWIMLGPGQRSEFNQTEKVEQKLGGSIIAIEGRGTDPNDDKRVIHHAFATMAYDAPSGTHRMRAYKADGSYIDALATVNPNGSVSWGFDMPKAGKVRFTMELNSKGQWHETGEFSPDGTKWFPNFEMTLDKVKSEK